MQEKFLISPKQKEELFHTELVKHGIPYNKAAKAARILVSNPPDETLSDEEAKLVQETCREWLRQRQRWNNVLQQLTTFNSIQNLNTHRSQEALDKNR
uniref:hypothetical protein n=1 Tax=Trichocoleus desertorum TaxID=1481672 RepID=UPI0025B518EF|nr:hypothetical protein [Trichocoleus desertorum]